MGGLQLVEEETQQKVPKGTDQLIDRDLEGNQPATPDPIYYYSREGDRRREKLPTLLLCPIVGE